MKLLDLKSFTDYVEAALPCCSVKWRIEDVTCNDNSATFRFSNKSTGRPLNATDDIIDRVAREMGRRGWHVDVWRDGPALCIGFTDEAGV